MHKLRVVPVAATVIVLLIAGCGGDDGNSGSQADATAAAEAVAGSVDEWSVAVDKDTVPAGKVTFEFANKGKLPHEVVIVKTDKKADALGTGNTVPEDGSVGEVEDIEAGATKKGTFDLQPGHYALICNISGHYKSGMHIDFTVT